MKYLLIGLGNVGTAYELTRHNIGFLVLDQLAEQHDVAFQADRLAFITSLKYKGRNIYLIKPTTSMNHSGKAANYWLNRLKLPIENSLVLMDDITLPFGKLRIRAQGSSAGHNGLKSVEAQWNTQHYPRLRFGIGSNFVKGKQIDYVLEKFSQQEFKALPIYMNQACEVIYSFCTVGVSYTMNRYNT